MRIAGAGTSSGRWAAAVAAGVLGALAATLAGCEGDPTEILVVVDSNLSVPGELDTVRVEVVGEGATASGDLTGSRGLELPRTVGIVQSGGKLGPLEIRAVGLSGGGVVVESRAITFFRGGKTLVLPLFLSRACVGVTCGGDQTCEGGRCVSATVDPDTLEEWNGRVPGADAGTCSPVEERCNGMDDDCDGQSDEGFDLQTDPINCGACMNACSVPNATVACTAGSCGVVDCRAGFGDCNGDTADGCENNLASADHCGACGNACTYANGVGACMDGACELSSCEAGFDDCNADPADGCETPLNTPTDCAACGMACELANATTTCDTGTCEVDVCDAGFDDCNADPADGCEAPLNTLTDCGACGTVCDLANASESCATGACAIAACDAGFGDCNTNPTDGCEQSLNVLDHCGACGARCTIDNGTGTCDTGTCQVASCSGDFGDCNSDPSDGCEIRLRNNDAHCGACGNACAAGTSCRGTSCS